MDQRQLLAGDALQAARPGRDRQGPRRATHERRPGGAHRSYLPSLRGLLGHPCLHGLAHITGGGLTDNLPRILPCAMHAAIKVGCWEIPPIFTDLQELGAVNAEEMFRVFNMGVGMVVVVGSEGSEEILRSLVEGPYRPFIMGSIVEGGSGVIYDLESSPVGVS